jgi:hypothetical protein
VGVLGCGGFDGGGLGGPGFAAETAGTVARTTAESATISFLDTRTSFAEQIACCLLC